MMCMRFLNFMYFLGIKGENIEIHTVESDSNNISLYLVFIFFSMLCKSVGLSSCWTIELSANWYPPYKSMVMIWTYWWYKIMYMHFLSHMLPLEAGTSRSNLNVNKYQIGLACWIFYSFANTCNSLEYNKKDNCLQNQWQQERKNWEISALCMVVLILREITWKVLMVDTFCGDV